MGLNGYLWISSNTSSKEGNEVDGKEESKNVQPNVVSAEQRQKMCRVRNSILALSQAFLPIHAASIMDVYFRSIELNLQPRDMLQSEVLHNLTQTAESRERSME